MTMTERRQSQNLYVRILRHHGQDAAAEQLTELLRLYSVRTKRRDECRRLASSWRAPRATEADRDTAQQALAEVDKQIAALEAALTGGSDD